jgi:GT2 family glycosyltransferase
MSKDSRKASVVIPNFNRKEDLERLLPGIVNQTFGDYEVIIVDDHSADKSAVEYIKTFIEGHGNMRLVENAENIGFVKTCNKGIKLANGKYICILTNDTEVAANFIQRNVEIMDADTSIGVLSCIIVDREGNNWFCGGIMKAGLPINLKDDFEGVRRFDFVAGTACFYRRDLFDKVGLLDEDFVMYHEDIEFCLRVQGKTDYRVCMFAEKLVKHYRSLSGLASSYELQYYDHRNLILIVKKHHPRALPKVLLHFLIELIDLFFVHLRELHPYLFLLLSSQIIKGTVDGLIKKPKIAD